MVRRGRFDMVKIVFRNKKFVFGFSVLMFFIVFLLIGGLFMFFSGDGLYYERVLNMSIKVVMYFIKVFLFMSNEMLIIYFGNRVEVIYFLGMDVFGKDVYVQLVMGFRMSFWVVFLVVIIGMIFGIIIGFIVGYKGGWVDEMFMMFINIMFVIFFIVLFVLIVVYFFVRSLEVQVLIIGIMGWLWVVRVVRVQIFLFKEREFVSFVKLSVQGDFRIIFGEIMFNMVFYVFMVGILQFSGVILVSVIFDFIGFGLMIMVFFGMIFQKVIVYNVFQFGQWWWFILLGFIIILIIMVLFFINFGMEEVFNLRFRRGGE